MEAQEEEWDTTKSCSFEQTGSILASMGFLPENVTQAKPDFKLYEELWELMEGEDRKGVSIADLKYVLGVIRGARDSTREIDCEPVEGKTGLSKMIIFDQDGAF